MERERGRWMLRVTVVCLMLIVLSGCAGTPRTNLADAQAPGASEQRSVRFHRLPPAGQANERLSRFRVASSTLIRQALLDEHERWAGTPYALGGDSVRGIDCSALMQQVFSDAFAVELPRTTLDQVREGLPVTRAELKAGDLVFFRPPGLYRHVGVYVGDGHFLHASSSEGVILSRLDNVYWDRYYWQARRPLARTELARRVAHVREG